MKLTDIDVETKLIIKFKYKEKPYSMIVQVVARSSKYIVIPSILQNNEVVDPNTLEDIELLYTVKDGIFRYPLTKLEASVFNGMRAYLVSYEEDVVRFNRREAYRVFIGELVKIDIATVDGKKRTIEGILKNISITGMAIILKQDIEIGGTISILYDFEGIYIHLLGKVIRKEKVGRYRAFSYGCMFKDSNYSINRVIMIKQLRNKNEFAE